MFWRKIAPLGKHANKTVMNMFGEHVGQVFSPTNMLGKLYMSTYGFLRMLCENVCSKCSPLLGCKFTMECWYNKLDQHVVPTCWTNIPH